MWQRPRLSRPRCSFSKPPLGELVRGQGALPTPLIKLCALFTISAPLTLSS